MDDCQIYVSSLELCPKPQTHLSNCLPSFLCLVVLKFLNMKFSMFRTKFPVSLQYLKLSQTFPFQFMVTSSFTYSGQKLWNHIWFLCNSLTKHKKLFHGLFKMYSSYVLYVSTSITVAQAPLFLTWIIAIASWLASMFDHLNQFTTHSVIGFFF